MERRTRLAIFFTAALCALSGSPVAFGETGALRGIAADVAAGRLLQESERTDVHDEQTDIELSQWTAKRLQAEQSLYARIRALYRITRAGMAPVAGGFDAVRRHVARIKRMTALVKSDISALKTCSSREQTLRDQVTRNTQGRMRARELLGSSREPLMVAEPPLTAADGTAPGPKPASSGNFYGLRLAEPSAGSDFSSHHGRLATPVAGEVRVVDARRAESQGSGLEFQAPAGTGIRAAAPGRVAFCDRYGSYGRLVIIDHGDGYYTAYGGLGRLEVRVGDEVSAFARLGTIAGDGGTPALYFEIRKGTKTLAPRAWLGL